MRAVEAKDVNEIRLEGVNVDGVIGNGQWKSITLIDCNGRRVQIQADYGMHVFVPEPPPKIKRWRVQGTILNAGFQSGLFAHESEAERARAQFVESGYDVVVVEVELEPESTERTITPEAL